MISTQLDAIKLNLNEVITYEKYCALHNEIWFDITKESNRVEFKVELLELFYRMIVRCKELDKIKDKDLFIIQPYEILVGLFKEQIITDINTTKFKDIYLYFLKFLYALKNKDHTELEKSLDIFSENLIDSISDFNHLFQVKDQGGDAYIFPVKNLVVIVTESFKKHNNNLLALTFTVNLESGRFHSKDKLSKEELEEKGALNKIIQDYNLKYLDYILNKNANILSGTSWVKNFKINNVIMVRTDRSVLIRNTQKTYFNDDNTVCSEDIRLAQRGYYIEKKIDDNKISNLDEWIYKTSPKELLEFLRISIDSENYNIFLKDSLITNPIDNSFVDYVNKFASNDRKIIYNKDDEYESTNINFMKCLIKLSRNRIVKIIDYNPVDFVTLNHYLEIISLLENKDLIVKFINIYLEKLNGKSEKSLNELENTFYIVLKDSNLKLEKVNSIYYKYIKLLENILEHKKTDHFFVQALPIKTDREFIQDEIQLINKIYSNKSAQQLIELDGYEYQSGRFEESDEYIEISTNNKENYSSYEYSVKYFSEEMNEIYEDFNLVRVNIINKFIVNKKNKQIFVVPNSVANLISNYIKVSKLSINAISYEYLMEINNQPDNLEEIAKLVKSGGYIKSLYESLFDSDEVDNDSLEFVLNYKIFTHLIKYKIKKADYSKWISLILEYHYCEPARLSIHKSNVHNFFDKCKEEFLDKGTIIIPLNGVGHDSTMKNIYKSFIDNNGYRDTFELIFDSTKINGMINKKNGIYYIDIPNEVEKKIVKILFVTDIVMTGSAATKTIKHYFGKNSANVDFFHTNDLIFISNFKEILDFNKPEIKIASIFCNKNIKKIDDELRDDSKLNFPILIDDTFDSIIFDKNKYWFEPSENNEIYKLFKLLYRNHIKNSFCCMIRYNNMPNKHLPLITEKTNKYDIGNLFVRKQVGLGFL